MADADFSSWTDPSDIADKILEWASAPHVRATSMQQPSSLPFCLRIILLMTKLIKNIISCLRSSCRSMNPVQLSWTVWTPFSAPHTPTSLTHVCTRHIAGQWRPSSEWWSFRGWNCNEWNYIPYYVKFVLPTWVSVMEEKLHIASVGHLYVISCFFASWMFNETKST